MSRCTLRRSSSASPWVTGSRRGPLRADSMRLRIRISRTSSRPGFARRTRFCATTTRPWFGGRRRRTSARSRKRWRKRSSKRRSFRCLSRSRRTSRTLSVCSPCRRASPSRRCSRSRRTRSMCCRPSSRARRTSRGASGTWSPTSSPSLRLRSGPSSRAPS
eukprot:Amastigsp_a179038_389.p3 type:complete len:161 gc:universal Amastigsp_a179038_389:413-895(+)